MKGILFVISGPSAVGKTSIANAILRKFDVVKKVVTCTTRGKRENEIQDVDYIFMSKQEFEEHISANDFIEHSLVYENYYGVLSSEIRDNIKKGHNLLLIINWKGFLQIKKIFPKNVVGIFIDPPSLQDLEIRIRSRGTDSEETIKRRLDLSYEDINNATHYDHRVVNDSMEIAANEVISLIKNAIKNKLGNK